MTLQNKLRFFQLLACLLAMFAGFLGFDEFQNWLADHYPLAGNVVVEPDAPHAKEIRALIAPLKYTGMEHFLDPEMKIVLDFKKKLWGLKHVHQFDKDGNVVLKKGRFGICGDMAAYTMQKIRPMFSPERYELSFLRVAESSYFNLDGGTHIIIEIVDKLAKPEPLVYLLDPSFRKYGSPHLFGTYLAKERMANLSYVKGRKENQYYLLDSGPPIHINHHVMMFLSVTPRDDKFDPDNFSVMLSVVKRYEYTSEPVWAYARVDGQEKFFDNSSAFRAWFSKGVYDKITSRMMKLVRRVELTSSAPAKESVLADEVSNMYSSSNIMGIANEKSLRKHYAGQ